ncbi:helix-turn-helix transcriptional regulator [Actinoplanes couchii]|uniref:Transcriptional regulator n=1 Tax=Actinoplanes couchii TaxID=403638 RepID=A0ABQ3XQZ6_9ACTN|nr:helix-turn-helix transcriptional regulator [Actinoplanes couchii]MDR6317370.1 transcriptional regulator with XRE-family HTH domain [Actinoplanes couchii]GID60904.1 transcriptional regulator [Actinoplanes couchii]
MSVRDEIRDFLLSRRARISPEQAGLPRHGERRVAGLRREEVAQLAGVSVEYYTRLERGNARGYSDDVLAAVARALHLDDAEREHLFDLVHAANNRARPAPDRPLRPTLHRLLDAMTGTPAYVWNTRLDIVAANPLGRALFAPLFDSPFQPVNQARFLFRDERAREFFPEWELLAHDAVAVLRTAAGRNPGELSVLVGELLAESDDFRSLWSAYDVRHRRTGRKLFHHPVAGPLTVDFESMALAGHSGLRLSAGTAEPGSPSEQALQFLANWTTPASADPTSTDANPASPGPTSSNPASPGPASPGPAISKPASAGPLCEGNR